jgi:hypothetical protein
MPTYVRKVSLDPAQADQLYTLQAANPWLANEPTNYLTPHKIRDWTRM